MKKIIAIASLFLLASFVLADTKDDIMAQYNRQMEAFKRKDVDAYFSVCTAHYWEKDKDGTMTLKQAKATYKKELKFLVSDNTTYKIDSLKKMGNKAVVRVTATFTSVWKGKDKKNHTFKGYGIYTDTWVKTAKGWMLASDIENTLKMTRDGKPMR